MPGKDVPLSSADLEGDLSSIGLDEEAPSTSADRETLQESEALQDARIDQIAAETEAIREALDRRALYAPRLFGAAAVWLVILLGIVCAHGANWRGFHLSDGVLIVLITGTTANILAVLAIVVLHYFPSSKR